MRLSRIMLLASSLAVSAAGSAESDMTSKSVTAATGTTVAAALSAVPFTNVRIDDSFWAPRIETNRTVSLPHSLQMLKKAGNIKDLELAAAGTREGYQGPVFIDSDLYKALEAVSYSLAATPDAQLEAQLDEIIEKIRAAQAPDGYLNTWFQVNAPDKRWTNLRDKHELYCAGHLIEAAVAHHAATGKRTLLDVAIKFADLIDSVFGNDPGKREGYPGHEELELALIKLWRVTGEQRYFDLAKFFLESRGTAFFAKEHGVDPAKYDGSYWQDNARLREHKKIVGHAVRAVYLLSGATDYAAVTGDEGVIKMLDRVWHNTTGANMYVTGGIGSSAKNEGFTHDFDLPNFSAYQETCASVAMAMWNHRLGLLHGNCKYADVMERALYNGFLAGVAADGEKYFYVNPLASRGDHHRKEWYSCACCPPNVTRTLAQLGGYAYATSTGALWVNLYIGGSVDAEVDGQPVTLQVTTDYPWEGDIRIKPQVASATSFELRLRVPGWSRDETVEVNGEPVAAPVKDNGYLVINRTWNTGDEVVLDLPMPVERVAADARVKENAGRLAIQRGPLVYCLEQVDNAAPVHEVALPADSTLAPHKNDDLLSGVVVLKGEGAVFADNGDDGESLYSRAPEVKSVEITAIPYYAWDNREPGGMVVWLPTSPPVSQKFGLAGKADVAMSFVNSNCQPDGCRDGIEPVKSSDQPAASCHWWPHKGSQEWVQYSWKLPQAVSSSRVFWFDDTGHGQCRVPKSWHLEYLEGTDWKPVELTGGSYSTELDMWAEVEFKPVEAKSLRLVVQMQDGYAAGVHEWQVER